MNAIDRLLEQGRKILADKRAADEANLREAWGIREGHFRAARAEAARLFAPFAASQIEPAEMPGDFDPDDPRVKLHFAIRPAPGSSTIVVVLSRYQHEWRQDDDRFAYYVPHNFEAYEDGDGAFGRCNHTTDSLAEAVALCEQETPRYLACIQRAQEQIAVRAAREKYRHENPEPSPAEKLMAAFEEAVRAVMTDGVEA